MLCNYYGKSSTPDTLNRSLASAGFFYQGTMATWFQLKNVYSDIICDNVIFCGDVPAPMDQVDAYLSAGKPVIVEVDFDHDTSDGIQTHFVLVYDKADGKYAIADPWFGDTSTIQERYCRLDGKYPSKPDEAILEVVFYSGTVPQQDLQVQLDTMRKQRDDNWNLHIEDQKAITDLQTELTAVKTERDQMQGAINGFAQQLGVPNSTEKIAGQIASLISDEDLYNKTQGKIQELTTNLQQAETDLKTINDKIEELTTQHVKDSSESLKLQSRNSTLQTEIDRLNKQLLIQYKEVFRVTGDFYLVKKIVLKKLDGG